jgi:hypothetical protein
MKFRKLGRTGLNVSEVGFGGWAIGGSWGPQSEADSVGALNRALDLGLTSSTQQRATVTGKARNHRLGAKNTARRGHCGDENAPYGRALASFALLQGRQRYPEKYLRENIEQRLRHLGTDRIDILQLHTWTRAWNRNPEPFEVLRALKKEGKVRFVGRVHARARPEQRDRPDEGRVGRCRPGHLQHLRAGAGGRAASRGRRGRRRDHRARGFRRGGSLTGKWTRDTVFPEGDFRRATSRATASAVPSTGPARVGLRRWRAAD